MEVFLEIGFRLDLKGVYKGLICVNKILCSREERSQRGKRELITGHIPRLTDYIRRLIFSLFAPFFRRRSECEKGSAVERRKKVEKALMVHSLGVVRV